MTSAEAVRLAAVTRLSADAVLLLDAAGRIEWANPAAAVLLGCEAEALAGRSFDALVDASARETWFAFLRHLVQPQPATYRASLDLAGGASGTRRVEVTAQHLLDEPAVSALVLHLRAAGEARVPGFDTAVSEEVRFRTLIEESRAAVFILQDDRIVYANPAAAGMLGYPVADLLALPNAFALVHEDDREQVIEQLAELGRPDVRTLYLSARGRRRDATILQAEGVCASTAFHGRAATLVTVFDIGERLRLEDQLRQTQKLEAVSRLAGGIAHDFNNLLATIRGNAELIALQLDPARAPLVEIEEIMRAADRAAALTRQLLAFGRTQSREPVVLDVNGVVLSVTRMARRLMGTDIRIDEDLEAGLALVSVDPGHLEQVLLNLIINARDAMADGGRVRIETATETLARGTPALADTGLPPGRYVRLSVSDDGVGMDAATVARVFEPFFTTKAPDRGTGLGLSTAYGIMRQSGGAIAVRSSPGAGATFDVYLPAEPGDRS